MDLYTLTTAAAKIGCDKSQTSRHARRLGLGLRLGSQIILTAAEVKKLAAAIRSATPGNPGTRGKNGRFLPVSGVRK